MLPLGHLAGGYLATKIILKFFKSLSSKQRKRFLIFGTFIALLSDIDLIYPLFKFGTIFTKRSVFNHHETIFHKSIFLASNFFNDFLYFYGIVSETFASQKFPRNDREKNYQNNLSCFPCSHCLSPNSR